MGGQTFNQKRCEKTQMVYIVRFTSRVNLLLLTKADWLTFLRVMNFAETFCHAIKISTLFRIHL